MLCGQKAPSFLNKLSFLKPVAIADMTVFRMQTEMT